MKSITHRLKGFAKKYQIKPNAIYFGKGIAVFSRYQSTITYRNLKKGKTNNLFYSQEVFEEASKLTGRVIRRYCKKK